MKKLFMAVIALMMTLSTSAQSHIDLSVCTVAKVDSISMVAPEELEKPNPSQGIGVFSVSADKQVTFSKGNLQYTQSTDTWSFAENQYDIIGEENIQNTSKHQNHHQRLHAPDDGFQGNLGNMDAHCQKCQTSAVGDPAFCCKQGNDIHHQHHQLGAGIQTVDKGISGEILS